MEQESTLSKKKETMLYDAVHSDIMNARVDLALYLSHLSKDDWELIDNRLSHLSVQCPQNAINLFKKK